MSSQTEQQPLGYSTKTALNRLYEDIRGILDDAEKQFTNKRLRTLHNISVIDIL